VRARNLLLMIPLGAALALLPAMASSETTPSIEAVGTGQGGIYETYAWSPTQITIGAGGSVRFSTGSTHAPHGIVWTSPTKPTCDSTVPVGESGEGWSGSCTFAQAGTYTFHCFVHEYMTGTVTVTAAGTTTTTSTSTAPPTPLSTTPTTTTAPVTPRPVVGVPHLTRAQKLARALRACRKKPKGKRATCRRRARQRYGPKR
jgi:plastocyanin